MRKQEPAVQLFSGNWRCGPAVSLPWQLFQLLWPETAASADHAPSHLTTQESKTAAYEKLEEINLF